MGINRVNKIEDWGRIKTVNKKLNIACGHMLLNGYINYDLLPFTDKHGRSVDIIDDIRNLKNHFSENSIQEILAFHCLEHLIRDDVASVLKQCFFILAKGGSIRVECPDMIKAFNYYIIKNNNHNGYAHCIIGGDSRKYGESWSHKSMWSAETMSRVVRSIGFKDLIIKDGTSHGFPERDFCIIGFK